MGKKQCISSHLAAQIVVLRNEGLKQVDIGQRLGIHQSIVSRTLHRHASTGSFCHRKSPGRPRKTYIQTDRLMKRLVQGDPTSSSSAIQSQLPPQVDISTRTIRRRLLDDCKLRAYRPACVPRLSAKNVKDRLVFARKYKDWTAQQWERVMFSDETMVKQFYAFSSHVRRPVGERYNQRYTTPRVKTSPSIMIWGSISAHGRGALWFLPAGTTINAATYLDILKEKLPRVMACHHCTYFQHDGAPAHTAGSVKDWITAQGIEIISPWPGSSPDINPIENCWSVVKKRVGALRPTSMKDLNDKIKIVWCQQITPEYCQNLIHSMPDRLAAVLAAKGGPTKY